MRTIFFSGLRVYSTPSLWSSSTQIPVTSSGVKSSERIRTAQELAWSLRRREFATGSTASFPNPLISSKTCSFSSASVVPGSTVIVNRAISEETASGIFISPSCEMAF